MNEQCETPAGPNNRFRAFVSYAHADVAFARRLQRRLEGYRLPSRLTERFSQKDAARHRVGSIFRDQQDLSANSDLSEAIQEALSASEALIVVCSPAAARSKWVAKEIELFRRLHPDRPILTALIDGKPGDAFPAALVSEGLEPLAADFRANGDGPRLGFLKVVAGLLNLPLDELVQRDAQRRLRSVMAVTAMATAAMLTLVVMTVSAINARIAAERHRSEAEGLVEFMLTSVRKELEAAGRLSALVEVDRRAEEYYSVVDSFDDLPDESLDRRSRTAIVAAADAFTAGRRDEAEREFEAAHRIAATSHARAPSDPRRIVGLARAKNRVALLDYDRGQYADAILKYEKIWRLLLSIETWGREREEWLQQSAFVSGSICASKQKLFSPDPGLEHCQNAVQYNERLIRKQPTDMNEVYELVFQLYWLAGAERALDRHKDAIETEKRFLSIISAMSQIDPDNSLWLEQKVEVYIGHAARIGTHGDRLGATWFLDEAERATERLLHRDASNRVSLKNAKWAAFPNRISGMRRKIK